MTVQYVRVNPIADLFAPATRSNGNIAVVGQILAAPAAPTLATATGTALGVGSYRYAVTFVTSTGESETSPETSVTTTANNQNVNVTAISTGPAGTIARRVYRTAVGGAAGSVKLVKTVNDNTTTTFNDTVPDTGLGAVPPPVIRSNEPVAFTDPGEARRLAAGALGNAIATAFTQTPGPTLVYGVRTAAGPDWDAALTAVSALDVQLVVLANTPLDATNGADPNGAVVKLANHVTSVSNTGGDGKECIGIAMLAKGAKDPAIVTGKLANERMVYIAHKSNDDVAAAVAGVIAGYEPHISILLKPVNVTSDLFTAAEIAAINGSETFSSGPGGQGVNWLVDPVLIPGRGIYMGEAYTGNPGGKKYIDIVRTIDDVSFRLKAQLINSIGALRISRSGLRALIAQMQAVLQPLVRNEVIEGFEILIPILALLDKDPASLTAAEVQQINNAQSQRVVEVLVAVDYAGAIHRLALTLKFE